MARTYPDIEHLDAALNVGAVQWAVDRIRNGIPGRDVVDQLAARFPGLPNYALIELYQRSQDAIQSGEEMLRTGTTPMTGPLQPPFGTGQRYGEYTYDVELNVTNHVTGELTVSRLLIDAPGELDRQQLEDALNYKIEEILDYPDWAARMGMAGGDFERVIFGLAISKRLP